MFSPCINVYKMPDGGSQLDPTHLAVNTLIKTVLYVNDLIHVLVFFFVTFPYLINPMGHTDA